MVMRSLTAWPRRFFRTWPVAAAAFAGLLFLIYTSVATTSKKAEEIYAQLDALNRHHREVENKLRRVRSDVHLSGIYIRDYLLDTDQNQVPEYRRRLTAIRASHAATVRELRNLLPASAAPQMNDLQERLDEYWGTFDPLFEWSIYEKIMRSAGFLRREVLPRREAVIALTADVEQLNNANVAAQRAEVSRRLLTFRDDLHARLRRALLIGFLVAIVAVLRLRALERRSERQRVAAKVSEREMRLLSQQLVAAQEEERKKLTRELHDHVGQMLTALRLEIGRADRLRGASDLQLAQPLAEARRLLDTILRSVRDLAMGLRPSMLDDFGLQPALEWHVRDFRRRTGIAIHLNLAGDLDALADIYRTCVYRIVQEALTNCARHAQAKHVEVTVRYEQNTIELSVIDDGVGIDARRTRAGMGLIGIEERVRELHGIVHVGTRPPHGTQIRASIPVITPIQEENARARAAG